MPNTRQIEMLVAVPFSDGDTGEWWTEYIDIPLDTPERIIEEVAEQNWWQAYRESKRDDVIAGLMVYSIPEIEDEGLDGFDGEFWDENAEDSPSDAGIEL